MTTPSRFIPSADPNVTPMIDVLLVLLIVFMTALVKTIPAIDTQLPQPCVDTCASSTTPIVLEVLPGPSYRINQQPVAPQDLHSRLSAIYGGRPEKVIHVDGASAAGYQEVMNAMDIARAAGVKVIAVVPKVSAR